MLIVPLQAVPSQVIQVAIGGQNVTVNCYQKSGGLFMDVLVNSAGIVYGVLCENLNLVVRSAYLGFVGDFTWIDNQSATLVDGLDPDYTGLGGRFSLAYLDPADISPGLPAGTS